MHHGLFPYWRVGYGLLEGFNPGYESLLLDQNGNDKE